MDAPTRQIAFAVLRTGLMVGLAMLLILGLLTRIDALFLAGTMGVAAFVVQLPDALHDPDAGANKLFASIRAMELPLSILAAMIALVLLGGGRWSVDALIFRKKDSGLRTQD